MLRQLFVWLICYNSELGAQYSSAHSVVSEFDLGGMYDPIIYFLLFNVYCILTTSTILVYVKRCTRFDTSDKLKQ